LPAVQFTGPTGCLTPTKTIQGLRRFAQGQGEPACPPGLPISINRFLHGLGCSSSLAKLCATTASAFLVVGNARVVQTSSWLSSRSLLHLSPDSHGPCGPHARTISPPASGCVEPGPDAGLAANLVRCSWPGWGMRSWGCTAAALLRQPGRSDFPASSVVEEVRREARPGPLIAWSPAGAAERDWVGGRTGRNGRAWDHGRGRPAVYWRARVCRQWWLASFCGTPDGLPAAWINFLKQPAPTPCPISHDPTVLSAAGPGRRGGDRSRARSPRRLKKPSRFVPKGFGGIAHWWDRQVSGESYQGDQAGSREGAQRQACGGRRFAPPEVIRRGGCPPAIRRQTRRREPRPTGKPAFGKTRLRKTRLRQTFPVADQARFWGQATFGSGQASEVAAGRRFADRAGIGRAWPYKPFRLVASCFGGRPSYGGQAPFGTAWPSGEAFLRGGRPLVAAIVLERGPPPLIGRPRAAGALTCWSGRTGNDVWSQAVNRTLRVDGEDMVWGAIQPWPPWKPSGRSTHLLHGLEAAPSRRASAGVARGQGPAGLR